MAPPRVVFQTPDGRRVAAEPDAIVGRSPAAQVRVDDPRVSTLHAEVRWSASGFVLIARGGRLVVDGRGAREVPLAPGVVVTLAPGVALGVHAIDGGDAPPVAATAGRERLRFVVSAGAVHIHAEGDDEPLVVLIGSAALLVRALLERRGVAAAWDEVAEAVWPEDGVLRRGRTEWTDVDERRFRNRWDQRLVALRRQMEPLRGGNLLVVRLGMIALRLDPDDTVE
jgi:hypothetical protein